MTDPEPSGTVFAWVRQIAADQGVGPFTDDELDWLLWEETAWPMGGTVVVERQLREVFTRMKQKGNPVPKPADLEIHDPVDDLPPRSKSPRASRWDTVIEAAHKADGRWIPVTKPAGFSKSILTDRSDDIVVETRGDKIFVKYDPDDAQQRRETAASKAEADD